MPDLINPYLIIGGAAVSGVIQAWLTGSFWRERHKLGLSTSAVIGFMCASITFSFVVATCYELLVKAQGWTHPVVLHPANWFESIRHWLGVTTLGAIQVPGLSGSIYGSLTAGRFRHSWEAAQSGTGAAFRSVVGNGEVVADGVGSLVDALARTPSPRFSHRSSLSSSGTSRSSSSGKGSNSGSDSDGSGGEAAGGLGALILAILRWLAKFCVVMLVLALGTGIAAVVMQLSAEYHESKRSALT